MNSLKDTNKSSHVRQYPQHPLLLTIPVVGCIVCIVVFISLLWWSLMSLFYLVFLFGEVSKSLSIFVCFLLTCQNSKVNLNMIVCWIYVLNIVLFNFLIFIYACVFVWILLCVCGVCGGHKSMLIPWSLGCRWCVRESNWTQDICKNSKCV